MDSNEPPWFVAMSAGDGAPSPTICRVLGFATLHITIPTSSSFHWPVDDDAVRAISNRFLDNECVTTKAESLPVCPVLKPVRSRYHVVFPIHRFLVGLTPLQNGTMTWC